MEDVSVKARVVAVLGKTGKLYQHPILAPQIKGISFDISKIRHRI